MYTEIIDNLGEQLSIEEMDIITKSKLHLGVFSEPCLSYMLEGKKTIESRFSKNKILPYEKIKEDDIVIVKASGGNVVAYFTIKKIMFFQAFFLILGIFKHTFMRSFVLEYLKSTFVSFANCLQKLSPRLKFSVLLL